jgi:hypothetical protein
MKFKATSWWRREKTPKDEAKERRNRMILEDFWNLLNADEAEVRKWLIGLELSPDSEEYAQVLAAWREKRKR